MAAQHQRTSEQRRFLAINFRIGTRESGYLVGPVLVSTRDYKRFHLWDEPSAALLGEDEYEILKVYRLGLTYDQTTRLFAQDFPRVSTGPNRSAGWIAPNGSFYSAQGWADLGRHPIVVA